MLEWRHGDDAMLTLFFIDVFHLQQHLVLLDAELGPFAYRQQHGMFFVARADAIDHGIALQNLFLTQQGMSLLVS